MHGNGDGARTVASAGCNAAIAAGRASRSVRPHCSEQRVVQPPQVAAIRAEIGRGDVDQVEAHDRIDHEIVERDRLAHDGPVHLARGRYVDHDVTVDDGRARRAGRRAERRAGRDTRAPRRVGGPRCSPLALDRVLGEVTERRGDHAPAAERTPVAHGVEIHAEPARGVEHRRADRHDSALPARGEHDGRGHDAGSPVSGRVSWGSKPPLATNNCSRSAGTRLRVAGLLPPPRLGCRRRRVGSGVRYAATRPRTRWRSSCPRPSPRRRWRAGSGGAGSLDVSRRRPRVHLRGDVAPVDDDELVTAPRHAPARRRTQGRARAARRGRSGGGRTRARADRPRSGHAR